MPIAMSDTNIDLDLTFLNEIADGSDEFIVESIELFLEQAPIILQEISSAINAGDLAKAATSAHSLKANLGFFGMLNSQALIIEIELACKTGDKASADIKAKFNELMNIIGHSFIKLNEIKAERAANL
jgi:HPt (histidine-containing phosphotransfer) domain-containing protein